MPPAKRYGKIMPAERDLVSRAVGNQPGLDMGPKQTKALKTLLRGRSVETVQKLIEEARANFLSNSVRYSQIHIEATEDALKDGNHAVAVKAAEWAMEHLSADGARVIEKTAATEHGGPRIQIGIKLGGVDEKRLAAEESA